jgi:hypothetical protein
MSPDPNRQKYRKKGIITSLALLVIFMLSYGIMNTLWDLRLQSLDIERKGLVSLPSMHAMDLGCHIEAVMMDWETMTLNPWEGSIEINGIQLLWKNGSMEVRQPRFAP